LPKRVDHGEREWIIMAHGDREWGPGADLLVKGQGNHPPPPKLKYIKLSITECELTKKSMGR